MPFAKLYFKTAACLYYRDGGSSEEFTGSGCWETRKHCAFKCRCPGESAVARFIADLQMKSHKCERKKKEMGKKSSHVIWAHTLCLKASGRMGEKHSWSGLEKRKEALISFLLAHHVESWCWREAVKLIFPRWRLETGKANTSRWRAALCMKQRATVLQSHEVSVSLLSRMCNCSGFRPSCYRQCSFFLTKTFLHSCSQQIKQDND